MVNERIDVCYWKILHNNTTEVAGRHNNNDFQYKGNTNINGCIMSVIIQ